MFALWWREHAGAARGQVIDLAIYEPLFWILGPQALVYDQLGIVQGRTGNAAPFTAPRNAYLAKDGTLARALGERPVDRRAGDADRRPRGSDRGAVVRDHTGRVEHADELDAIIQDWIGRHTTEEVLAAFAEHEAAIAPDQLDRRHLRGSPVQGPRHDHDRRPPEARPAEDAERDPAAGETPGRIDHPGPELGEHNRAVYVDELGLTEEELAALVEMGVVADAAPDDPRSTREERT